MPIGIGLAIAGIAGAGASIFGASEQVSAEQQAIQQQQQMLQQGLQTQSNYLGQASGVLSPFVSGGQSAQDWYNYLTGASNVVPGAEGASNTLGTTAAATSNALTSSTPATGAAGTTGTVGNGGTTAAPTLNGLGYGALTQPFTAASLPYTPGYQFTLGQGLKSAQSGYASEGLGSSGPAVQGAAAYATGQASNTYNSQFSNYLTQNAQIAQLLLSGGQVGAGAAETMASLYGNAGNAALGGSVNTGQGIASSTAGIGNALAGGAAGVSNSLSNSLLTYALLNKLGGGTTAGTVGPSNSYVSNALLTQGAGGGYPYTYNISGAPGSTG